MKRRYVDHFGDTLIIDQHGESVFVSIDNKGGPVDEACVQLSPRKLAYVIDALLEAERRAKKARSKRR